MAKRNFDNTNRFYNGQVLKKTRMHMYTKTDIDNLMKKCMFDKLKIPLLELTEEDIANFKLRSIKNKDNIHKEEGIDNTSYDETAKKKQKSDTNGIDVLKSVLSRESETLTFESQFNFSLKPIKEIASTSIKEVPTVIDCDKSTKSPNFSAKNVLPKINVIDARKMMEENKYINWMKFINLGIKPKHTTNGNTNLAVAESSSTSKLNPSSHTTKVNVVKDHLNDNNHVTWNLIDIEKLHKKYFGKSVQDIIIAIANILNLMSLSNKHHKERMDEIFKKISNADKFKERCNANYIHTIHKTILETKLKTNFGHVLSTFSESEFDSAFKLFSLSILTVLRILYQPKPIRGCNFNNLILLLSTSLKNSTFNHPKMFSILQSKKFQPECIKIISMIEDTRDTDPGIVIRMPLFFLTKVDSHQYFKAATDTVTGKLNENLSLLIDNATSQCCINSKIIDSVDSSTVEHSNQKLPVTETIQCPGTSDVITQTTFRFKNKNGTYQLIPLVNANKSQTIGNSGVEPSIVTSQPLNSFYDTFSSSLQKTTTGSSSSTMTASSSKTATPEPSKRTSMLNTSIQNIITKPNSYPHITDGHTVVIGNKPYKIVSVPPSKIRTVEDLRKKPSADFIKCFVYNCKEPATVMCGKCQIVKYCSENCQRQHWCSNHEAECDNMIRQMQTQP